MKLLTPEKGKKSKRIFFVRCFSLEVITLIRGLKRQIFTAFTVGARINLGAPTKRHNLNVSYTQMPKNIT